jgi:hypothetical protein
VEKGQEGANVKACNEFGNDPMKMCSEHKIRMKVATYLTKNFKILKIVFFIIEIVILDGTFVFHEFVRFGTI